MFPLIADEDVLGVDYDNLFFIAYWARVGAFQACLEFVLQARSAPTRAQLSNKEKVVIIDAQIRIKAFFKNSLITLSQQTANKGTAVIGRVMFLMPRKSPGVYESRSFNTSAGLGLRSAFNKL